MRERARESGSERERERQREEEDRLPGTACLHVLMTSRCADEVRGEKKGGEKKQHHSSVIPIPKG